MDSVLKQVRATHNDRWEAELFKQCRTLKFEEWLKVYGVDKDVVKHVFECYGGTCIELACNIMNDSNG